MLLGIFIQHISTTAKLNTHCSFSLTSSDKTGLSASLLLEQGVNPNAIEVCNSRTPLHVAVLRNNKAVARAILAHDHLDVNQKVISYMVSFFPRHISALASQDYAPNFLRQNF